jgi:hypothetical protein
MLKEGSDQSDLVYVVRENGEEESCDYLRSPPIEPRADSGSDIEGFVVVVIFVVVLMYQHLHSCFTATLPY